MGNCCPTDNSYAVEKPPQEHVADIAKNNSCITESNGSSYRKKKSSYGVPSSNGPQQFVFENEALDLRERTLDDPAANGTITAQPVSATKENTLPENAEALANTMNMGTEISNCEAQSPTSHGTEASPTKTITTTTVFSADDVRQSSVEDFGSYDPDYDTIQQALSTDLVPDHVTPVSESQSAAFSNQVFQSDPSTPKSDIVKTTEVVMRIDQGRPESDVPGYASIRTRSGSGISGDSHAYSNPDMEVFSGTGTNHNARDIGQASVMQDEDDYAAIAYKDNVADDGYPEIGDNDVQLEMKEAEDDPDYYEIGHPNIKPMSLKVQKDKTKPSSVSSEPDRETQSKKPDSVSHDSGNSDDENVVSTDDIYAIVDKSRKTSHRSKYPLGQPNDEEDRELNEMWMEIETIEEKLCNTLTRDTLHEDVEEDKEDFYFTFVNDTIQELSQKNYAMWHKKASDVEPYHAEGSDWAKVSNEDDNSSYGSVEEVNASYQKFVDNLNKRTAKELMEPSKRNEEDILKIISEHRNQQLELFKWREAERRKFDDKLRQKLTAKQRSMIISSCSEGDYPVPPPKTAGAMEMKDSDSDSDIEKMAANYRGLVTAGDNGTDEVVLQFSSEGSRHSSSDEESLEGEGKQLANETLKRTLKDDVTTNLKDMTNDDFKNLMGLYRKSRMDITLARDAEKSKWDQSLWDKLAQRRKEVDHYVYENEEKSASYSKTVQTNSNGSSSTQPVTVSKIESSTGTSGGSSSMGVGTRVDTQDAETGMNNTFKQASHSDSSTVTERNPIKVNQEIERLDSEFIKEANSRKGNVDHETYHKLIKEHLDSVSKLRGEKDAFLMGHREKMLAKLKQRKNLGAASKQSVTSNSSSSDSDSEPIQSLVNTVKDKEDTYQMELDENKNNLLLSLTKDKDKTSSDQMEAVLKKYHRDQEEVLRKRQLEREATDQKLQQKLESRKRKRQERFHGHTGEDDSKMGDKDSQFYNELIEKRQQGKIRDEDIGRLIEEHLSSQEEEVKRLKREARRKYREQRKKELEANPELVHNLVEQEREKSKQRQQITMEEKAKMDKKLKEKLNKRKQKPMYTDSPEIPAPRLPPKEKLAPASKSTTDHSRSTVYENVELSS